MIVVILLLYYGVLIKLLDLFFLLLFVLLYDYVWDFFMYMNFYRLFRVLCMDFRCWINILGSGVKVFLFVFCYSND